MTFVKSHAIQSVMQMAETPSELLNMLKSGQRLMGLDLGSKTIGMAIGDTNHKIASPFDTIRRKKFGPDAALLADTLRNENIGGLVIGLPL
ncbi:MAG: RuvX/YqgF family protein, partial [Alphaproteobacteria bacterium]|nr:RuvX/YqgF family protein [Alphaproteobacteria bacterium]